MAGAAINPYGATMNPDGSVKPPTAGSMTPEQLKAFSGAFSQNGGFGAAGPVHAPAAPAVDPYGPQAIAFYRALDQNKANDAWNASNQQYIDAFNKHYADSQGRLQSNLNQALGELGQRRDAAAQVVAGLPGQINSSYNFASGLLGGAEKAGLGALSKDVRGGASAYNAPALETLALNRAAGQNLAPFLNLGMMANYQSGAAGLRQQEMVGEQSLADQRANFDMEQLHTKSQHEQAIADRAAEWAHQDAATQSQRDWQSKQAEKEHGWKTEDTAAQNKAALGSTPALDPALAQAGLSQGDANEVENSPLYQRISSQMARATPEEIRQITAEQSRYLSNSADPLAKKILAVLNTKYGGKGRFDSSYNVKMAGGPSWLTNRLDWSNGAFGVRGLD